MRSFRLCALNRGFPNLDSPRRGGNARGACCPDRGKNFQRSRKFQRLFCPTFCALQKVGSREAAKGFNWACAKFLSVCAASRFAEPRSSLKKVLIVAVRSCSCGALIRGLENLEACPERETGLFFSRVRKEPKVHQRFANLWTPGTIQSSAGSNFAKISGGFCRNRFCPQNGGEKALNRCERVTVVQTQD